MNSSKYKEHADPELIALCLQGDKLAWETLLIRYRRLIYSAPVRFGLPPNDAADIFQAVCVKLLEHLHEVKDDRKISLWLMKTTMRMCIQLKGVRTRDSAAPDEIEEPLDPTDNLEEQRIAIEKQQAMREAVDELAPRCRSLIEMLYYKMPTPSYDQISQSLGMPVASVGPNRARCLEKLRTILRRRGIGD